MAYTSGELLVRDGTISAEAHRRALALRAAEGGSLGECLIRLGLIDEHALAMFYHKRLVLPLVPAGRFEAIDPAILALVPAEVAAEFRAVPVSSEGDGTVLVAMADPSDAHAVEELSFFVGSFVLRGVATESVIRQAIERYYKVGLTAPRPVADAAATPTVNPRAAAAPSAPALATPAAAMPLASKPVAPVEAPPVHRPAFVASPGASGRVPVTATAPESPLFPADHQERNSDPFGPRAQTAATHDGEVVILTNRKKRNDETPLPLPSPPFRANVLEAEPVLLDQPRRRERAPTLPGISPATGPAPAAARAPTPAPARGQAPILALRTAPDRDAVAQLILDYAACFVTRATLFVVRKGLLAGFDARGDGLDRAGVAVLQIPLTEPSLFRDVTNALLPFRGPLPDTAQNRTIARAMGVSPSAEVLLWPILIRDRVVAILFGDGIAPQLPEADLQATLHEAGMAYARIIMQARANSEDLQR